MSTTKTKVREPQVFTAEDFMTAADWPSVREAAEAVGVSQRWLMDHIRAGRVRALRLNVLRVDMESFIDFLNHIQHNPIND